MVVSRLEFLNNYLLIRDNKGDNTLYVLFYGMFCFHFIT